MKLYEDYCPRCPREMITDNKGRPTGRYKILPAKCRDCNPDTFTDGLRAYISVIHQRDKLREEIEERRTGLKWYEKKRSEFHNTLKKHCEEGKIRVISLTGVAVVLDWTGDHLFINHADIERDPKS